VSSSFSFCGDVGSCRYGTGEGFSESSAHAATTRLRTPIRQFIWAPHEHERDARIEFER
jgi:hypothetical protein